MIDPSEYNKILIEQIGYYASQKKKIQYGTYVVTFSRRRRKGVYLYIVTLKQNGSNAKIGLFTEYGLAVKYAGSLLYGIGFR
ncbi:hypothetical protein HS7_16170 [Sulfolobales archaeon HS-7]|nr:hypothetical protein HS7_16170 [Sulfolobales archaeon HS-7]